MEVFRLYLVNSKTGKKTGKKRDYPSLEHFYKYGIETYQRYNREEYFRNVSTGLKAELCFLNNLNKWEKVDEKTLKELLNKEI